MVIAQQVEHRMNGQEANLTLQRMAVGLCLLYGCFHGDYHIAQQQRTCFLIDIVNAVLAERE